MSTLARTAFAVIFSCVVVFAPLAVRTADAQAPAAARALPRGHVLEAADIVASNDSEANAAFDQDVKPGWITRRVIREGEPLRAPAVVPPPLVARGDTVTVYWRVSGIQITGPGVALGDAALGDTLLVRLDALRRIKVVAKGPSTVDVP